MNIKIKLNEKALRRLAVMEQETRKEKEFKKRMDELVKKVFPDGFKGMPNLVTKTNANRKTNY